MKIKLGTVGHVTWDSGFVIPTAIVGSLQSLDADHPLHAEPIG
jgi:hypothetical protein